jgi:hypothetical protein
MSNNPEATAPLPDEMGKPLEASLKHLVQHSGPYQTEGSKDELAGALIPSTSMAHNCLAPHVPIGIGQAQEHTDTAASEQRKDAIHTSPKKGRGWISHLFPSEETLDKVSYTVLV